MKPLLMAAIGILVALSPASAFAQVKTVTLGSALPLTGASANLGRNFRDGYRIAVDRINELGGLRVGKIRYRLALMILDNHSDANLGVREYVQLVTRDKVDFLLGPYGSDDTLDDSTVAEKYRIPMVEGGGSAEQIFTRGYKYVFGTAPPADHYFRSTFGMMTKLDPRPRTVALIVADDAFDVAVAKGVRALARKDHFAIILDKRYSEHGGDFSALLSLIKSKSPDVILWGGHETAAVDFVREAKRLDVHARDLMALTIGVPSADFRAALGRDADDVFGMTPWLPSSLAQDPWFGDGAHFAQLFRKRFRYAPDYHVAQAVACVETVTKAIAAAGTLDKEKVRAAIAKSNFESLYATIAFQPDGQIDLPQIVVQVQNGEVIPIYTDHFLNKPRYPVPARGRRG